MKKALLFLGIILGIGAGEIRADVDDCDDYLMRHYRRDLKPVAVIFSNKKYSPVPMTDLKLKVKNVGEVAIGSDTEPKSIKVDFGAGIVRTGSYSGKIQPGASRVINMGHSGQGIFSHCQKRTIQMDITRTAGQWGCQCFANDTEQVTFYKNPSRVLCF